MDHISEKPKGLVKKNYDYHLRLIGSAGVGKSALTRRMHEDIFCPDDAYKTRIVCDWLRNKIELETATITLLHCDTVGQEQFGRDITRPFYQRAHCVCVVFDLTNRASLEDAAEWLRDAVQYAPHVVKFLVGNKSDLREGRIDSAESIILAKNFGARYLEVSAASGQNTPERLIFGQGRPGGATKPFSSEDRRLKEHAGEIRDPGMIQVYTVE